MPVPEPDEPARIEDPFVLELGWNNRLSLGLRVSKIKCGNTAQTYQLNMREIIQTWIITFFPTPQARIRKMTQDIKANIKWDNNCQISPFDLSLRHVCITTLLLLNLNLDLQATVWQTKSTRHAHTRPDLDRL